MSKIPEDILQAGCTAYSETFLNASGSFGEGIEAAYFAINDHDDWVRAGPKEWSGEGLPPQGEWCEILSTPEPTGRWCKGKILYISKSSCVWCWDENQIDMCANTFKIEFRPIRTPEQIAAEERKSAIDELVYGHDNEILRAWAAYVYDTLGYRKV